MDNIDNTTTHPTKQVFILQPLDDSGTLQVYSNRELVYKQFAANRIFMRRTGKPPKPITSYIMLCRIIKRNYIVKLIVLDASGPVEYRLIKAPVITKHG